MCAVVPTALPQANVVSPMQNFQFILYVLLHVHPLGRQLRKFHVVHELLWPFTISSWKLIILMCGLLRSLFCHSLLLITFAEKFACCTLDRKQWLDFRRLVAGIWPNSEWVSFVNCFCLSALAHTYLLIAWGAIPDSKCQSSTLVGLRHHRVTDQHALFNSGSRFWSCPDWSCILSRRVAQC